MNEKFRQYQKQGGKSNSSTNPDRKIEGKADPNNQQFRSKAKIKLLNLYTQKPDLKKMWKEPNKPARIQPDRKWFGNIRTIDQKSLEKFRVEINEKSSNPNEFMIKAKKLPISLLKDPVKENRMNLLEIEKFEVFAILL